MEVIYIFFISRIDDIKYNHFLISENIIFDIKQSFPDIRKYLKILKRHDSSQVTLVHDDIFICYR